MREPQQPVGAQFLLWRRDENMGIRQVRLKTPRHHPVASHCISGVVDRPFVLGDVGRGGEAVCGTDAGV